MRVHSAISVPFAIENNRIVGAASPWASVRRNMPEAVVLAGYKLHTQNIRSL
jgi:hypothetical protein